LLKQTAYEKTMQMPLSFMAHGSKHKWAACIWMCLFSWLMAQNI